MYTAKIDQHSFSIEWDKSTFTVNGKALQADIVPVKEGDFHVLSDNRSYAVELLEMDRDTKTVLLRVNGNKYSVVLQDRFDALLHQLGMDTMNSAKVNDIKAPMPGLVLKVLVKEGQQIKKGDGLVVLEAMKMENILKAPADATVKSIRIQPTDKVEKNQVLMNLA